MRPKRRCLIDNKQATAMVEKLTFTEQMDPVTFTELCVAASMGGVADLLVDAGAIVVIVAALKQFQANRRLQKTALDALKTLMGAEGGCALAVLAGCVDEVLLIMESNQADPTIQMYCCQILSQICLDARLIRIAPSLRWAAGPALIQAMRQHNKDVTVQFAACQALVALLDAMPVHTLVMLNGGIEAVIAAMLKFSHNASFLNCACITLSSLLRDAVAAQRILELGGVEVVVEALRLHKHQACVQEAGCFALWPLSLTELGKATILKVQGARHLVQAMQGHPLELGIQQCCSATLAQLCHSKAGRKQVTTAGGKEAVLQALKLHSNDPKLQLIGRRALERMKKGTQVPRLLKSIGIIPRRSCPSSRKTRRGSALWSTIQSLLCLKPS
eukprot:GGOE01002207.1.p1 GENE.GGOE01002207.1~~GGOE01002207.1.p1  ORF type:complete len:388 (+),score=64.57 GGOE01002207.1:44-1207(+)